VFIADARPTFSRIWNGTPRGAKTVIKDECPPEDEPLLASWSMDRHTSLFTREGSGMRNTILKQIVP